MYSWEKGLGAQNEREKSGTSLFVPRSVVTSFHLIQLERVRKNLCDWLGSVDVFKAIQYRGVVIATIVQRTEAIFYLCVVSL